MAVKLLTVADLRKLLRKMDVKRKVRRRRHVRLGAAAPPRLWVAEIALACAGAARPMTVRLPARSSDEAVKAGASFNPKTAKGVPLWMQRCAKVGVRVSPMRKRALSWT